MLYHNRRDETQLDGFVKRLNDSFFSIFIGVCLLILSIGSATAETEQQYTTIEWIELMPADDLEALLNPPDILMGIEDGSELDSIDNLGAISESDPSAEKFYKALKSDRVVETYNGKSIRLPGFVVPLANDENNNVTEFFIVPYFGACLHLPPPPPNQIIFVKTDNGFQLESLQNPFWFEGVLSIEQSERELGTSAYRLNLDSQYLYEE